MNEIDQETTTENSFVQVESTVIENGRNEPKSTTTIIKSANLYQEKHFETIDEDRTNLDRTDQQTETTLESINQTGQTQSITEFKENDVTTSTIQLIESSSQVEIETMGRDKLEEFSTSSNFESFSSLSSLKESSIETTSSIHHSDQFTTESGLEEQDTDIRTSMAYQVSDSTEIQVVTSQKTSLVIEISQKQKSSTKILQLNSSTQINDKVENQETKSTNLVLLSVLVCIGIFTSCLLIGLLYWFMCKNTRSERRSIA